MHFTAAPSLFTRHWIIAYQDEIIPVNGSVTENGIKGDTNMEKVSKLAPAFIKPHGTAPCVCAVL
jgi:hypothetical protein